MRHRPPAARVALILLALSLAYGAYLATPPPPGPERAFSISAGEGASSVARRLEAAGFIRSWRLFLLASLVRGEARSLKAGEYRLRRGTPLPALLEVMVKGGPGAQVRLTVPEGMNLREVAALVERELGIPSQEFLAAARAARPALAPPGSGAEGFLFPDTYYFRPGVEAGEVVARMLGRFDEVARGLPWERAPLGLSPYQVVVVASMVEGEARLAEERPMVAAVIYNRLKAGMPLQIDATVQYALGTHKPRLSEEDLKVDSPFNTYLHAGLPPAPISNPGRASLEAALNPAPTDALYYVLVDPVAGRHAFTRDYQEFLRLKAGRG